MASTICSTLCFFVVLDQCLRVHRLQAQIKHDAVGALHQFQQFAVTDDFGGAALRGPGARHGIGADKVLQKLLRALVISVEVVVVEETWTSCC